MHMVHKHSVEYLIFGLAWATYPTIHRIYTDLVWHDVLYCVLYEHHTYSLYSAYECGLSG